MKFSTALKLGRVSNLPTVLSNILVGIGLTATLSLTNSLSILLLLTLVVSLIYVGGMYLNDAVDAEFDKQFNPSRPIAAGEVRLKTVLISAVAMLAVAMGILVTFDFLNSHEFHSSIYGLVLIACVVIYDLIHKKMRFGPWVMGACRFMVYVLAASIVGKVDSHLLFVAFSVYAYVVGLTYIAKTEHLNQAQNYWPLALFFMPIVYFSYGLATSESRMWEGIGLIPFLAWVIYHFRFILPGEQRNVPFAIARFIAGIALLDATILIFNGAYNLAMVALICFGLTLALQRKVAGT